MTHPETDLQKESVLNVLKKLDVDSNLIQNIVEVHNKMDQRYSFKEEVIHFQF